MRAFDPDPELRWLFAMTHPDDEISICAWIKFLATQGNVIHVSWTHSTPTREREARAVMRELGVLDENLHFLYVPDGHVCHRLAQTLPAFRDLIEFVRPDRIACGAFEQGHLDHDATNWLVNQISRGPVFEIPFYHSYHTRLQTLNRFSHPFGEQVRRLNEADRRLKIRMARQYPSQTIWRVLTAYELWQRSMLRPARLWTDERMRLQTHRDFLVPNHGPRLSRKILKSPSWKLWTEAVKLAQALTTDPVPR